MEDFVGKCGGSVKVDLKVELRVGYPSFRYPA